VWTWFNYVDGNWCFGVHRPWACMQQIHPKWWCPSTKLHGITSQSTVFLLITAVKTSNLTRKFILIAFSCGWGEGHAVT
jgi:hypothetical protein